MGSRPIPHQQGERPVTANDDTDRLWGLPGAGDWLRANPAEVWKHEIKPFIHDEDAWAIEEWTVTPNIGFIDTAANILEFVAEMASDDTGCEDCWDAWEAATKHPDVIAATEQLRSVLAAHVAYKVAGQLIATHQITLDADGNPLLDGDPMYRKATP